MTDRDIYLSSSAIDWASAELRRLPKNQLLLLFLLALAIEPKIARIGRKTSTFQLELERYLAGPIPGGGTAFFNPIENTWRSEEYFHSTVVGRLLNGSHGWTSGPDAYIKRSPSRGWPATFEVGEKELRNLKLRNSPPCLKGGYRLPPTATAIWYFKFDELSQFEVNSIDDLRERFLAKIYSANANLAILFEKEESVFWGEAFQSHELSSKEKLARFPKSSFGVEPKKTIQLYSDDIKQIMRLKEKGETPADYIKKILRGK